jgi:hypothetical protein
MVCATSQAFGAGGVLWQRTVQSSKVEDEVALCGAVGSFGAGAALAAGEAAGAGFFACCADAGTAKPTASNAAATLIRTSRDITIIPSS